MSQTQLETMPTANEATPPLWQRTSVLYALCILIWGSTWLAMHYQAGTVPAIWSVALRFGIAAMTLMLICLYRREPLFAFTYKDHVWFLLQGLTLFGVNFYIFYTASHYLVSGLCALIFSLISLINIINARLFLKTTISKEKVLGALIGIAGLMIVFETELTHLPFLDSTRAHFTKGIILACLATYIASVGHITNTRNALKYEGLSLPMTVWAMCYGTLAIVFIALESHTPFHFDSSSVYLLSLLYLTLFGTVIGFLAFATLLKRIGPSKTSYMFIITPIAALLLSSVFESYHWTWPVLFGIGVISISNIMMKKAQ